jgi:hypothetical protein
LILRLVDIAVNITKSLCKFFRRSLHHFFGLDLDLSRSLNPKDLFKLPEIQESKSKSHPSGRNRRDKSIEQPEQTRKLHQIKNVEQEGGQVQLKIKQVSRLKST